MAELINFLLGLLLFFVLALLVWESLRWSDEKSKGGSDGFIFKIIC